MALASNEMQSSLELSAEGRNTQNKPKGVGSERQRTNVRVASALSRGALGSVHNRHAGAVGIQTQDRTHVSLSTVQTGADIVVHNGEGEA